MDKTNTKRKILEEVCCEKGIDITDISYQWVSILRRGKKERILLNNSFYINPRIAVELAKDKYATYALLNHHQIPMIKHQVLFHPEKIPEAEKVNRQFQCLKNNQKQVIKPNDSSEGRGVFVSSNPQEKVQIVEKLFQNQAEAIVVCPYEEIEYEYRVLFLYGEIIYFYKKQKPFVIGDGKSTLKELIQQQLKYLIEPIQDLDLDSIPVKDEKITVGWKHNLCQGAIPLLILQENFYDEEVKKIALEVGKIMNLNFASIDVILTEDKKIFVMEVNSQVTITKFCELVPNGYQIGKEIYGKVIDRIFEN